MAVYTKLNRTQIETLLERYQVGALLSVQPVLDGIENTNYFLNVASRSGAAVHEYLLTVFEQLESGELIFYMRWLSQLKHSGLPVAPAIEDTGGRVLQQIVDRPAALFEKLEGSHPLQINDHHCYAIGAAIGQLHAATLNLHASHAGPRDLDWMINLAASIRPRVDSVDIRLLDQALQFCRRIRLRSDLPHGLIHGDLFPDNTLFEGKQLTGLVDFFSGGEGLFGFDLAVAINAWCSDSDGSLNEHNHTELLRGYLQFRAISAQEHEHWADFLIVAATRFWVSRLADQLLPEGIESQDSYRKTKDPNEYRRILENRLKHPVAAPL